MPTKKKPLQDWTLDVTFFPVEIHVKARTKGEARKKAMKKLRTQSAAMHIDRRNTDLDKRF